MLYGLRQTDRKISGSEPGPAAKPSGGQTVTLYEASMPKAPVRMRLQTSLPDSKLRGVSYGEVKACYRRNSLSVA